jgi:hypothetical protein
MNDYIIIELEMWKVYKIGMLSNRFIGPKMYMPLADTYYFGRSKNGYEHSRENKFATYEEAVKAIDELNTDLKNNQEYDNDDNVMLEEGAE